MTASLQDGDLWGPCVYDGSKKGEYVHHSIDSPVVVEEPVVHSANAEARKEWINKVAAKEPMYKFTVQETGETWVGPMPEGSPIPKAKVTIVFPATEYLVVQRTADADKITPEQLLELKIDGNLTLHDLLSLAQCEGQLSAKDYGDDSSFNGIAQGIINAVQFF